MEHLHFIGIEGSGASAAAAVAKAKGYKVTGCDRHLSGEYSSIFDPETVFVEHSKIHLKEVDAVILSPAIETADPNNAELKAAKDLNLAVLTWQQFLGKYILKDKFVIAVCGTHGKSTTTAMIGTILTDAGLDPTVVLGAKVDAWGENFRIGKSNYFVIEADEYNNNFMAYSPSLTVVTNIDVDHLEYFKDFAHIQQSFEDFLGKTKDTVVANLQDPYVAEAVKWVMKQSGVTVLDFNKIEANLDLKVPGQFNIANAKAAFQVGLLLEIDPQTIIDSLNNYQGISRRFEKIGTLNGAQFFSDFAHHPREVFVTLEAARQKFPEKKITLIFQPHLYSRTKLLLNDFIDVLQKAPIDRGVIVDIFASRENDPVDINSRMMVDKINMGIIEYQPTVKDGLLQIKSELNENCVVILMGAGDIDLTGRQFLKNF